MSRKPADLSEMLAKKGEAEPATDTPEGDASAPARPMTADRIDGRYLRRSDRVQMGIKIKPTVREKVLQFAIEDQVTIADVIEAAVETYAAQRARRKK